MKTSPEELMVTVDSRVAAKVVVLWWLLSLVFVRVLIEIPSAAPLLEAVRRAVPAVQKYAQASGFDAATTAFYCVFLISAPFVARFYFRFVVLRRPLSGGVQLILWLVIPVIAYLLTIGVDLGPARGPGFRHLFKSVMTSSWLGSSFVFMLFWHGLLSAIACVAKNEGRRWS